MESQTQTTTTKTTSRRDRLIAEISAELRDGGLDIAAALAVINGHASVVDDDGLALAEDVLARVVRLLAELREQHRRAERVAEQIETEALLGAAWRALKLLAIDDFDSYLD